MRLRRTSRQWSGRKLVSCSIARLAALVVLTGWASPARAVTLVEKGQARAVIILAEKPMPAAEYAARVLRDHIRQIARAELPIRGPAER